MPSGVSRAVVFAARASDPDCGSVRAYAPISSPLASLGRYFAFCSGVPNYTIGKVPIDVCVPSEPPNDGLRARNSPT